MLEALVNDPDTEQKAKFELFDKFFAQLEKNAQNLTSNNVCRALSCLNSHAKLEHIKSSKNQLRATQMRAAFLIDRLTEMLARDSQVTVLDLYWSNRFASQLEEVFTG